MTTQLDTVAPNYRTAAERWPDAPTLANHYRAVSESLEGSGHGLIETVKSFVECVCLTILSDHGESAPTSPSTSELLVSSLRLLGVSNTRGVSKLDKVLSAYNRLSDALNDCRNEVGPIAHGKDGFLDTLYRSQLRTYLLTGDALLALILGAMEGTEPNFQHTREPYETFIDLHDRIDSSVIVGALVDDTGEAPVFVLSIATSGLPDGVELRVEPSRLLYAVDRAAFVEVLAASTTDALKRDQGTAFAAPKKPPATALTLADDVRSAPLVKDYDGRLDEVREDFYEYLGSLGIASEQTLPGSSASLAPSLLATADQNMGVDWQDRPSLLSGMRVAVGRVLRRCGVPPAEARADAERIVTWLRDHTSSHDAGSRGPVESDAL